MTEALYDYTRQDASGGSCTVQAWAKVPAALNAAQKAEQRGVELRRFLDVEQVL